MTAAEKAVLELDAASRLRLIESLWESLRADVGDELPISDAARAELDRRSAAHDADPGATLTWDAVKARANEQP